MSPTFLSLGLLLISAHLVRSSYFPDEWKTNCKKENGYMGNIGTLNYSDPASVPRPAKCYMACLMGKQQVMKPDGSIDFKHAKEIVSAMHKGYKRTIRLFHRIVDACAKEYKKYPDKCDTAFYYVKCKREKYDAFTL